jgi:diguanylate cyclase (GGDEF)-like protein
MNILAEGVLILDRREHIVLANSVISDILNRPESNLMGKKASVLGWELASDPENKNLPWLVALQSGNKQVGVRVLLKTREGKSKIFSVNAVPIMDGESSLQGVIAVFDDVSELEEKSLLLEQMLQKLASSQAAIEIQNKELFKLSVRDPLTDCFNRRALYEHLEGKFDGVRASDAEYSCIMLDIDHFKRVNDTYGHNAGDEVIKMVANIIREQVRDVDLVSRFGGEEFCIVLPGAPLAQACLTAERCRKKIAASVCNGIRITSSFGVTSKRQGATSPNELIHQADQALYFSKQNGRNRVTSWADIESSPSPVS